MLSIFFALSSLAGADPMIQNSQESPSNPFIWADVPDMSIVRSGSSWFMSSTTMHMSPGLPIMKSDDLVNWRLVSYGYERLEENDALNLLNGRNAYGAGSWASSLRVHDGLFYASTFSNTTGKSYIFTTKNPETEPWRRHSTLPFMHDHSLFFDDDGRVYMVHGGGAIRLTELLPDLTGIKPGGVDKVIISNATKVAGGSPGLPAEGSQLLKFNGRYYISNIAWPRGGMRTQIIHRADSILGPYEGRILLQDKGIAQGSLIDTPDGRWFAYLFQDSGAVGRIPYLVPIVWEDGWPTVTNGGRVPDRLDIAAVQIGAQGITASDEFERQKGAAALPLAWQWNHQPVDTHWSVSARPGWLRLSPPRLVKDVISAPNTLTQRTFGPRSSAQVLLDFSRLKDGDSAGLLALQKRHGWLGVKREAGQAFIVLVTAPDGAGVEQARLPLAGARVHLRLDCDFNKRKDETSFFFSLDGSEWEQIGEPMKMHYDLPHFMGYRFGLFCFSTESLGGHADFDFFRLSSL